MKPLIGISPTPNEVDFDHGHFRRYALANTYTAAVVAAGGIPVILPTHPEAIEDTLDVLDALIMSGGGDLDASLWGEETHPKADGIDEERDRYELAAIRKAVSMDMPLLGICRGIQTINVALGGSLIQDLPSEVPDSNQHRQHREGKMQDECFHTVTIDPGPNLLYRIHGKNEMETNSFHHQAVKDVGTGIESIATAADGTIEAVWIPRMTFGLAVQWHPEMLAANYPDQAAIFSALVDAAAARKTA